MELYSAQSFFLNGYKTPDSYTGISVQDGGSMVIATQGNYNLNTGSSVAVGAGSTLTFKGQGSYTTANMVDTHIDNGGTVTFKLNGNGGWATGISGASSVQNREGAVFEADGLLLSGGSTFVNDGTLTGHKVIVQDAGEAPDYTFSDGLKGVTVQGGAATEGTGTPVVSSDSELTVKGEVKANVASESNVKLTNDRLISGNLHVATASAAANNAGGSISGQVTVDGTMTNNGTILGETTVTGTLKGSGVPAATTIAETATLIVGNSPGYTTFTDALPVQSGASLVFSVGGVDAPASLSNGTGRESHTYSQIVMENAPVTLCDGVNIMIAFGGDVLCSTMTPLNEAQVTPFELVLIKGGVASTLDLVSLMEHTSFVLSSEEGAVPLLLTGQTWALHVADAAYRVDNGNLVLSGTLGITRAPEPATTTLSLLAPAALAARRRK